MESLGIDSSDLEKIREKSAEEKKMIAITTSGVVVGFIFFIWFTTLVNRINIDEAQVAAVEESEGSNLFQNVGGAIELLFDISPSSIFDYKEPVRYTREENNAIIERDIIDEIPPPESDFGNVIFINLYTYPYK